MSFTGKATYSAGANLPELAEDVSDLIGIVSPSETPLLNIIGDSLHEAVSTRHEWVEDSLLPNKDKINDSSFIDPLSDTDIDVANGNHFQIGDQVQVEGASELMLVTAVNGNTLNVVRGYAGTTPEALLDQTFLNILGNAALEGASKPQVRFTNRQRKSNTTQIFTASVEVSGSDLASRQIGLADEMDYQKQMRLRELLRDLENSMINGGQPVNSPQGSDSVRRTMRGIIPHLQSNIFHPSDPDFPAGDSLDEEKLSFVLRKIWESSNGNIDLIVVNGFQKRKINAFIQTNRSFDSNDQTFMDQVSRYESDFGMANVLVSRWVPQDAVLLLDSSRLSVMPMSGRHFHFKSLASGGDYECGQLIGEYTLELKNEQAHGIIRGLTTA